MLVSIMLLYTMDFACRFGQSCQSNCLLLSQIGNCQLVPHVPSTVFEPRGMVMKRVSFKSTKRDFDITNEGKPLNKINYVTL
jgi:hypothetical protein